MQLHYRCRTESTGCRLRQNCVTQNPLTHLLNLGKSIDFAMSHDIKGVQCFVLIKHTVEGSCCHYRFIEKICKYHFILPTHFIE